LGLEWSYVGYCLLIPLLLLNALLGTIRHVQAAQQVNAEPVPHPQSRYDGILSPGFCDQAALLVPRIKECALSLFARASPGDNASADPAVDFDGASGSIIAEYEFCV
jgi:hypothetical protein